MFKFLGCVICSRYKIFYLLKFGWVVNDIKFIIFYRSVFFFNVKVMWVVYSWYGGFIIVIDKDLFYFVSN